jgi:hypothetical protein
MQNFPKSSSFWILVLATARWPNIKVLLQTLPLNDFMIFKQILSLLDPSGLASVKSVCELKVSKIPSSS